MVSLDVLSSKVFALMLPGITSQKFLLCMSADILVFNSIFFWLKFGMVPFRWWPGPVLKLVLQVCANLDSLELRYNEWVLQQEISHVLNSLFHMKMSTKVIALKKKNEACSPFNFLKYFSMVILPFIFY